MEEKKELGFVATSDLVLYRKHLPNAKPALVARAISLGLAPEAFADIQAIQEMHGTSPAKVLDWIEETGAKLELIFSALEANSSLFSYRASTIALLRIAREVNPQTITIEDFMATFADIFGAVGGWFPLHRLVHFVNDQLDGDWQRAYFWACESPETLIAWLQGKIDSLQVAFRESYGELLSEERDEGSVGRHLPFGHHVESPMERSIEGL